MRSALAYAAVAVVTNLAVITTVTSILTYGLCMVKEEIKRKNQCAQK